MCVCVCVRACVRHPSVRPSCHPSVCVCKCVHAAYMRASMCVCRRIDGLSQVGLALSVVELEEFGALDVPPAVLQDVMPCNMRMYSHA